MNLLKCILKENECYKTGDHLAPVGMMLHSTGADNPMLKRYVEPEPNYENYEELMRLLGDNRYDNDWNHTTRLVCVHGFVGKLADGSVASVQTLPWDMRGWHAGRGYKGTANDTHIGIEICEDGLDDPVYFAAVYKEAVELAAMLCRVFKWNPLADGVILCHSEGYKRGTASNHGDVMHWFPKHGKTMDDFRADVAAEMKKQEDEDMDVCRFKELWHEMRKGLQDNDAGTWSEEARNWAVDNGIVQGSSEKEFNGMWEDVLTREQMVTLLYRFAKLVGKA